MSLLYHTDEKADLKHRDYGFYSCSSLSRTWPRGGEFNIRARGSGAGMNSESWFVGP